MKILVSFKYAFPYTLEQFSASKIKNFFYEKNIRIFNLRLLLNKNNIQLNNFEVSLNLYFHKINKLLESCRTIERVRITDSN